MTLGELARLIHACRHAQKQYQESHSPRALNIARDYERRLDRAVAEVLGSRPPSLFDGSAQGDSDD